MRLPLHLPAPYERFKPYDDCMHEECGVFGIYSNDSGLDAAEAAYYGLFSLQHRGQESAGIAVSRKGKIDCHKAMGLVSGRFCDGLASLKGSNLAIGHVRYSTMGDSLLINAQPLVVESPLGPLALAHNGNIINAKELRGELEADGASFQTTIDSEIIAALIAKNSTAGLVEGIAQAMERLKGSYALVMMTRDQLIGVRDPKGMRPLALGSLNGSYVFASESCAFDTIGAEFIRDVRPGEIIVVNHAVLRSHQTAHASDTALCIFEYVYFARPDSDIDGISVHKARERAGELLAISSPADVDVVSAVPAVGDGLRKAVGATIYHRAFKKSIHGSHVHRTFAGSAGDGCLPQAQRAQAKRARQARSFGGRLHRARNNQQIYRRDAQNRWRKRGASAHQLAAGHASVLLWHRYLVL